jgi:predicted hotdog family 3-hydroxylacyl-ACP dehydratase
VKPEYTVAELVPHTGTMSLLTRIIDYGDDWLSAEIHITPESIFADERGVPAWIGLEYMAQAIAAYGGRQERERGGNRKKCTQGEEGCDESGLTVPVLVSSSLPPDCAV